MKIKKSSEVRFSRFKEDWEEYKLGELYTERKEKGHDSLPMLSVSIQEGISDGELDITSLRKSVVRSEDKSLYKRVYPGDLVLNMMRAWQGAYGVVTSAGMVSPAYITANPNNQIYPPFMDYCLRRDEMIAQINNLSYGVTDFRKRLYWKSFVKISCFLPSISEQKRITSFFTKVDELIFNQQQKLNVLKQSKQGFLEKMFPKEEETMPEFRFQGFKEEWKRVTLSEMLSIPEKELEKNPMKDKLLTVKLHCKGIQSNRNTGTLKIGSTIYYKRKSGQFIYGKQNFFNGAFGIIPDEYDGYLTSADIPALDIIEGKVFPLYLLHFISRQSFYKKAESLSTGTGSKRIHEATILNIKVYTPSLEEQIKIGNFFKQLDQTIELHEKELETLKETKKAFSQKMFV